MANTAARAEPIDDKEDEDESLWDRMLPWRRRARIERTIQRGLDRMAETVNGIKQDHGLDDLMIDIERARAQGESAMEKEDLRDDQGQQRRSGKIKKPKP